MRKVNLQPTSGKENSQRDLLKNRNLKRKDNADRKNKNKDINDNVGNSKHKHRDGVVDTLSLDREIPPSRNRSTAENNKQNVGESIEADETEKQVDRPADKSIRRDAKVESKNGELRKSETDGVDERAADADLPEPGAVLCHCDVPHVVTGAEIKN